MEKVCPLLARHRHYMKQPLETPQRTHRSTTTQQREKNRAYKAAVIH